MWPLPEKIHDHISLIFEPTRITCCALTHKRHNQFELHALQEISLLDQAYSHGIMFNPTFIGNAVIAFIKEHRLKNPSISCALADGIITETFFRKSSSFPEEHADTMHRLRKEMYLYPDDQGLIFYANEIPYPILAHYTAWAYRYHLPLIGLMSSTACLLALYQYIYGPAYRPAQLAQHLKQKNNDISSLFSSDLLERILHMPRCNEHNNYQRLTLLKACGLLVIKGIPG